MKRSWFFQNRLLVSLLALVLLLHTLLLMLRYQRPQDLSFSPPETPLKIHLREERTFKKQIVQSADPKAVEELDEKEKAYLSDKDRSFKRQTRARVVDRFHQGGGGKGKSLSLSDLSTFSPGHHPLKGRASGQGKGVSASNDFVEDVALGDLSYLNTVEYKYYGFFHRIRQKLEQFWGRSIQEKTEEFLKAGRRLASGESLITGLMVVMSPQGKIIHIQIKGSSGVKELDEAAVEAFNQAGPFPHPPKGLIRQGRVQIEWGFVVDT